MLTEFGRVHRRAWLLWVCLCCGRVMSQAWLVTGNLVLYQPRKQDRLGFNMPVKPNYRRFGRYEVLP